MYYLFLSYVFYVNTADLRSPLCLCDGVGTSASWILSMIFYLTEFLILCKFNRIFCTFLNWSVCVSYLAAVSLCMQYTNCIYERPQGAHCNKVRTIVLPQFTEQLFMSFCKTHNQDHHSSVLYVVDSNLPECYAVSTGKLSPTFRRTVVTSSSRSSRVLPYWAAWPCSVRHKIAAQCWWLYLSTRHNILEDLNLHHHHHSENFISHVAHLIWACMWLHVKRNWMLYVYVMLIPVAALYKASVYGR